jgi:DMSO/TMAO reductase YedYZ molybdopterin-dependent catalytic subunit
MFVAAAITASVIAVFHLAWRLLGLPFPPFEVFDWTARVLPGSVVAFGIESMVAVIRFLNVGPTAATAKLAEQAMGIGLLFVAGLILGTILFAILRATHGRYSLTLGFVFGILLGVPITLIGARLNQTGSTSVAVGASWILMMFLAWGLLLGWANRRLFEIAGAGVLASEDWVRRVDRRRFLIRLGGSTAAITVLGAAVGQLVESRRRELISMLGASGRWSASHPLPNAGAALKPAAGTRPELTPLDSHYRIDIDSTPPEIDPQLWKLKLNGLVEQPRVLSLDELRAYAPLDQFITLSCISNPVGGDLIGTTRWTGVSLRRLLPSWRLKPSATHLKIRSADDFFEVVPLEAIRADERIMLAYAWDGVPLTHEHGFPLRIYIPDVYGMKQPKWIESIEAIDHWEPGYWVKRGWDKEARMKATAVIDTVAVDMKIIEADRRTLVPIGGIAHAGARGISKVELRVDDGPWQPAALRAPLSPLTWVIWRFDWPFQAGKHTFTVRCFDGQGVAQVAEAHGSKPSGATGLYSKTQML